MEAKTKTSVAQPNLETAEGFAAYISEALAAGNEAVIEEAFATLARTGGKSWTEGEASPPREDLDPVPEHHSPRVPPPRPASCTPPDAREAEPRARAEAASTSPPNISLEARESLAPEARKRRKSKARRCALPGITAMGGLAALLAFSLSLNPVEKRPASGAGSASRTAPNSPPPSFAQAHAQSTPEPAALPSRTVRTAEQSPAQPADDEARENRGLATQRDKLQAQARGLAAQVAAEAARLNQLRTETGRAAERLAMLPQIDARIAQETSTLFGLENQLQQAKRKLAAARTPNPPARTVPRQTQVALASPAPAPAPAPSFSSLQGQEQQWQREGEQLVSARGALSVGNTEEARQMIESVQTQLVFQPVTPDNPTAEPNGNVTAALLGQVISLLNAGETSPALGVLDHAISEFGVGPAPASYTPPPGSG